MPRLVRLAGAAAFVRTHLDAPGVGADRRDLLVLAPVAILELDARRIAAGIAAPFAFGVAAFHLAGAHDDEIALADLDILLLGALVEFVVGNAFAVLQPVDAAEARNVQKHAAADHLVARVLDAENAETLGVDQVRVMAVIGFVLVEDVAERVPMRRALHAQHDGVVGITQVVPVLPPGGGVGAGGQHLVNRVEAAAEQAVLRTLGIERHAQREHLAGSDQLGGVDDVLRRDVIERADMVFLAPAAPVGQLLGGFSDGFPPDLDVHGLRFLLDSVLVISSSDIAPCAGVTSSGLACNARFYPTPRESFRA